MEEIRMGLLLLIITLTGCLAAPSDENTHGVKKRQMMFALTEDETSSGDICDPTRAKPCEIDSEKCTWDSQDMIYKCTHPITKRSDMSPYMRLKKHKKKDKEEHQAELKHQGKKPHTDNKREIPAAAAVTAATQEPFHSQPAQTSRSPVSDKRSLSEEALRATDTQFAKFQAPNIIPEKEVEQHDDDDFLKSNLLVRSAPKDYPDEAPDPPEETDGGRQISKGKGKNTLGGGTLTVYPYKGTLTWDGNKENAQPCVTKNVMADNLQALRKKADKKQWAEEHENMICDFTKFFHCVIIEEDKKDDETYDYGNEEFRRFARIPDENGWDTLEETEEAGQNLEKEDTNAARKMRLKKEKKGHGHEEGPKGRKGPQTLGALPSTGVCRCYDSSMTVVDGKCYLPADAGAKSDCENITAPYPIRPWKSARPLRPTCTPNSDCKESQYWFGKRCTCRWYAKLNPETNACDEGTQFPYNRWLLWGLILMFCFMEFIIPL